MNSESERAKPVKSDSAAWPNQEPSGTLEEERVRSPRGDQLVRETETAIIFKTSDGLLKLGGESEEITTRKQQCSRCTFSTTSNSQWCLGCGVLLGANPCLDLDRQISINLQKKEEDEAFVALCRREQTRFATHHRGPLFAQAENLATQIQTRVEAVEGVVGIVAAPHLILNAVSFIEDFHRQSLEALLCQDPQDLPMPTVRLFFQFSTVVDAGPYEPALVAPQKYDCKSGVLSESIEAAFKSGASKKSEPQVDDEGNVQTLKKVGWIIAMMEDGRESSSTKERKIQVSSGTAMIKALNTTSQRIPLASFDASLRTDCSVQNLCCELSQVCQDFFWDLEDPDFSRHYAAKWTALSESASEADIASRLKLHGAGCGTSGSGEDLTACTEEEKGEGLVNCCKPDEKEENTIVICTQVEGPERDGESLEDESTATLTTEEESIQKTEPLLCDACGKKAAWKVGLKAVVSLMGRLLTCLVPKKRTRKH